MKSALRVIKFVALLLATRCAFAQGPIPTPVTPVFGDPVRIPQTAPAARAGFHGELTRLPALYPAPRRGASGASMPSGVALPVPSPAVLGPSVPANRPPVLVAENAIARQQPPGPLTSESDALRNQLNQTNERLAALERQLQETRQPVEDSGVAAAGDQEARVAGLESAFDEFRDALNARTTEKFPSAKLTGFLQLDDYLLSQDALNKATVGDGQNGLGFRRARLAVVGSVSQFTNYMMEVDFATAGRPSFFDVWGEQEGVPILGSVRAGQYLQPFSVDAMSGFRTLPFLERSLPFLAFVPFRRVGVMASNNNLDERLYWAYSLFRTGGFNNSPLGDSRFASDIGDQGGLSFSTRSTFLVTYDEPTDGRYLWQIGGGFNYSQMTGNTASGGRPFYQARTLPEFGPIGDGIDTAPATFGPASYAASNFTPPVFVDSGRYLAKDFALYGLETVYQAGPFSFQSEFMATDVLSAAGPIWYTGAYVEGMYRLTGEHRTFDKRLGALKNPVPFTNFLTFGRGGIRGWGAWEVAARLSYVDLRNPARLQASQYVNGTNSSGNGTLTDTTLGGTWFLNYHTKLQFNWIHSMLNNTARGYSQADFFVTRFQVDF